MACSIVSITLVVREYGEAIAFFTDALQFTLIEDKLLGEGKRWVRVAPPGSTGASLLLAKAATPEQQAHVGNQTGERVFLFLETSDFWSDYNAMQSRGVRFIGSRARNPMGGWWYFWISTEISGIWCNTMLPDPEEDAMDSVNVTVPGRNF